MKDLKRNTVIISLCALLFAPANLMAGGDGDGDVEPSDIGRKNCSSTCECTCKLKCDETYPSAGGYFEYMTYEMGNVDVDGSESIFASDDCKPDNIEDANRLCEERMGADCEAKRAAYESEYLARRRSYYPSGTEVKVDCPIWILGVLNPCK